MESGVESAVGGAANAMATVSGATMAEVLEYDTARSVTMVVTLSFHHAICLSMSLLMLLKGRHQEPETCGESGDYS